MRVLKNHPKTTNFRQFSLSFCQKVTKKLQKARKIVNIRESIRPHPTQHELSPPSTSPI